MTNTASTTYFGTDGNAALKPTTYRSLTLIQGYKNAPAPAPQRPQRPRQNAKQEKRFVVAALLMAAALSLVLVVASAISDAAISAQSQQALSQISTCSVIVQPGDSLWSIAESHPVDGLSTSQVVTWISQKNSLDNSSLQPGQTISVPQAQ
ncbi:MAG: LysM peptidoglycan-binding domain-containing protein [Tractidigestivibacter sp.]|jgi:nucleoid-associated protein YgaU|uniref:LysM peptidoglycan-binding domain-containing protein n=1 Tax=Tractidigestivibacter sp. TaxID=2847320 RepID=UPI003D8B24E9